MQTWTGTPEDYLSQRPNRTHLQWICSVGNALLTFFLLTHVSLSMELLQEIINCKTQSNTQSVRGALSKKLRSGVL